MRTIWDVMTAMRSLYSTQLDAASRECDLARVELDILLFLANNPQFDTATDIVERRCISKAHVSQSVKSLERLGYLERCYEGDNRRTIHLRLTENAQAAVNAGRQAQLRCFETFMRNFSATELEQFRDYLSRIAENVHVEQEKGNKR